MHRRQRPTCQPHVSGASEISRSRFSMCAILSADGTSWPDMMASRTRRPTSASSSLSSFPSLGRDVEQSVVRDRRNGSAIRHAPPRELWMNQLAFDGPGEQAAQHRHAHVRGTEVLLLVVGDQALAYLCVPVAGIPLTIFIGTLARLTNEIDAVVTALRLVAHDVPGPQCR